MDYSQGAHAPGIPVSDASLLPAGNVFFVAICVIFFLIAAFLIGIAISLNGKRSRMLTIGLPLAFSFFLNAILYFGPDIVDNVNNSYDAPLPSWYESYASRDDVVAAFDSVSDLHADTLFWRRRNVHVRGEIGHVDIPRLLDGKVRLQVFAMVISVPQAMNLVSNERPPTIADIAFHKALLERWPISTWVSHLNRALFMCSRLHTIAQESNGTVRVVRSAQDLDSTTPHDRSVRGILASEGASVLQGNIANLQRLYDAGLRVLGPTHFFDTEVGGSQSGKQKYGLTEFGRAVLRQMKGFGMILDLAHGSRQLLDDVTSLEADARPCVMLSHTGINSVCPSARNVDDEQLRKLASIDAIVGISLFNPAMCDDDDLLRSFSASVRHAISVVGVEHVAFGSDFDGAVKTSVHVGQMSLVYAALLAANVSVEDTQAVLGRNAERFFRRCLPAASS